MRQITHNIAKSYMDILSLLQSQNLEIKDIIDLINGKQFSLLYSRYQKVIEELLFITSEQEFDNFIEEGGCLELRSFLLAYASNKKVCCAIGIYEENADVTLRQYVNIGENVILHDNYESADYLVEDIKKINSVIANTKKKCIALFDDTYCEGVYYIFKIDIESDNGAYMDRQIERLI